ncbi:MAG TPA: helix-turn-helix transcriptional regulator [Pirellulales bacterium]|jgi:plasmid maintenance system antidote protein VapI
MKKKTKATTSTSLSTVLREALENSDVSRYRLSQITGIPEITLGRFLRDERDVRLKTADALADALGLELVPKKKPKG